VRLELSSCELIAPAAWEFVMPTQEPVRKARPASASHDDLRRLLGDIDEDKAIKILALNPTVAELEQVAMWATGEGDVLAKSGHPLTGLLAVILDIVTADEEEPPPTG
jgi:hypothetical protein